MQSRLHLIIWDRFSDIVHNRKMQEFKKLTKKKWAKDILFMLRPLGRPPETYFLWQYNKVFELVTNIQNLNGPRVLPGGRTGHCKM